MLDATWNIAGHSIFTHSTYGELVVGWLAALSSFRDSCLLRSVGFFHDLECAHLVSGCVIANSDFALETA